MHVLLATAEVSHGRFLQRALRDEHYTVELTREVGEAECMIQAVDYDLAIIDSRLPKLDGLDAVRRLRAGSGPLPIVLLTEGSCPEDRVKALDWGADDCLSKPFSFSELSARARAVLRRRAFPPELTVRVEDLELSWRYMNVRRAGRQIRLTSKEFALLAYLMRNAGCPLTRTMILGNVWGSQYDSHTNIVDVYVFYLRAKIDKGFDQKLVRTVRGVGYCVGREGSGWAARRALPPSSAARRESDKPLSERPTAKVPL